MDIHLRHPIILWFCGISRRSGGQNSGNEKSWVPPSHSADYFSTFEMNTESKEPVRKTQGKGNWPAGWFMVKWRTPGGIRGRKVADCNYQKITIMSQRSQDMAVGSFSFLAIPLWHKSVRHFCITFYKHSELRPNDLRMFLFRVNIRQLRQENNLWNPRLGKQTGLIPLAMAVAVGRNSAHNAYQLRLPVVF